MLHYFSVLGCSDFSWYRHPPSFVRLSQESVNPSVYTRLHCYLPWIAKQYFMLYTSVLDPIFDPACNNGQGDINEVGTEECRSNPTNQPARYNLVASPEESSCIFPFQLDGQEYNKCILQGIEGFTQPLFKCPVRRIKNSADRPSATSYLTDVVYFDSSTLQAGGVERRGNELVNVGYCPTNCNGATGAWDGESNDGLEYTFDANGPVKIGPGKYDLELDPENRKCLDYQRLPMFAVCKNNCPGGNVIVLFFWLHFIKKNIF